MITPAYIRTMAQYNEEMNRRVYQAASCLTEAERRTERGAFWGSIHGTLNHLLWADRMWMSRFASWPKPDVPLKQSTKLVDDFAALRAARETVDADLLAWAGQVDAAWLEQDQTWFSGSVGRELRAPRALLIAHFFNHQTHHRGQVHAMLTAAGQDTGDTDLFLLVRPSSLSA